MLNCKFSAVLGHHIIISSLMVWRSRNPLEYILIVIGLDAVDSALGGRQQTIIRLTRAPNADYGGPVFCLSTVLDHTAQT